MLYDYDVYCFCVYACYAVLIAYVVMLTAYEVMCMPYVLTAYEFA